jgi:hypothetical protein
LSFRTFWKPKRLAPIFRSRLFWLFRRGRYYENWLKVMSVLPSTCLLRTTRFTSSIFQYISNKMQLYTVYLYLETALHVSGVTSTHHQERIQMYLQHLVFVTTLLLSAAIVEELEPVWVCCGWRTLPTAHSNRFQLFHGSGR